MPGVAVSLDQRKSRDTQSWQFKGGLRDYLAQSLHGEPVIPFRGRRWLCRQEQRQLCRRARGAPGAWPLPKVLPLRKVINLIPDHGGRHA